MCQGAEQVRCANQCRGFASEKREWHYWFAHNPAFDKDEVNGGDEESEEKAPYERVGEG